MGVVYKLKDEVRDFILEQKRINPAIGCRTLATLAEDKFQVKLSKSSVNAIIKNAGMSMPVGRRSKEVTEVTEAKDSKFISETLSKELGRTAEVEMEEKAKRLESEKWVRLAEEERRRKLSLDAKLEEDKLMLESGARKKEAAMHAVEDARRGEIEARRRLEEDKLLLAQAKKLQEEKRRQEEGLKKLEEARRKEIEKRALAEAKKNIEAERKAAEKAKREAGEKVRREIEEKAQRQAEEFLRIKEQAKIAQEAVEHVVLEAARKAAEEIGRKIEDDKRALEETKRSVDALAKEVEEERRTLGLEHQARQEVIRDAAEAKKILVEARRKEVALGVLEEELKRNQVALGKAQDELKDQELREKAHFEEEFKKAEEEKKALLEAEEKAAQERSLLDKELKKLDQARQSLTEGQTQAEAERAEIKVERKRVEEERLSLEEAKKSVEELVRKVEEEKRVLEEECRVQKEGRLQAQEAQRAAEVAKQEAEEAARVAEAVKQEAEEAVRKAIEQARREAEEEAKRKAQEEAKRRAEEEKRAQEEAKKKADADAEAAKKAEAEVVAKKAEEVRKAQEQAKQQAEEEAKRKALEAAQKAEAQMKLAQPTQSHEARRLQEEETARQAETDKWKRLADEERLKKEAVQKSEADSLAALKAQIKSAVQPVSATSAAAEEKCTGVVILKAAEALVGASRAVAEVIRGRVGRQKNELAALIEEATLAGLAPAGEKPANTGKSDALLVELQADKSVCSDIQNMLKSNLQEVRCIKLQLSDGNTFFVDGQMHTIWSTQNIPYDFSGCFNNVKGYINKYFYQNLPFTLFVAPGYDTPTKEFFSLIMSLDGIGSAISKLTIFGNKFEELEIISFDQPKKRFFIFSFFPWQFSEQRKVNKIGEFKPMRFVPLNRELYVADVDLTLSQSALGLSVQLRGCAFKLNPQDKARQIIVSNIPADVMTSEDLANAYLGHWPNLEEAYHDYSRKVELFTYTVDSQRYFSTGNLSLSKPETQDPKSLFVSYLEALDSYVRWHFLPMGFETKDLSFTKEFFYDLDASLSRQQENTVVTFQPSSGYAYLKELQYLARRINEREVVLNDGSRLWLIA
ncbi:MAG: hypothetical protein NTZ92_05900 [Candidatus Omnitrophica bacterium]|nr:hypothetical protein [Candidatus Omnitrophota bacterium]